MSISGAVAVDTPFGSQSPLPSTQQKFMFFIKTWVSKIFIDSVDYQKIPFEYDDVKEDSKTRQ